MEYGLYRITSMNDRLVAGSRDGYQQPAFSPAAMRDAISAYHDLLTDDQLAADSQAILDDQLGRHSLVFGGRRSAPSCARA